MIALLLVFQALLTATNGISVAPTWVTSPFVKAAQVNVIRTMTDQTTTPKATLTFSSAFAAIPNLGYGVVNYEGNDQMGQEFWEVRRTKLTTTSFSVKVQIRGTTIIWLLTVRYIAIDDAFPHHLNSFDNVPVNYSNGLLKNITKASSSLKYYVNTINYTKHCKENNFLYTRFTQPYTNFKILLFVTSIFIDGTNQWPGQTPRPLDMRVKTTILSDTTYRFNVTSKIQVQIHKLHFSMIIFDEVNVEASHQYALIYRRIDFSTKGGFVSVPKEFMTNLIMGWVEYSAPMTDSCLDFNLKFQNKPGTTTFGVYMPKSVPRYSMVPFSRFGFTLFYMKTWICPNNTFFDLTTDMCVSCPVPGCLNCTYIDLCNTCNSSAGLLLDVTAIPSKQCTLCPIPNCLNCTGLTSCLICNTSNNYFLQIVNGSGLCILCTIPYCITCQSLTTCTNCDEANNYFVNPEPEGASDQCIACTIPQCVQCANLSSCAACNESNNYFLNPYPTSAADQCIACTLSECVQCQTLATCSLCSSGWIVSSIDGQCIHCPIPFCIECLNTTECELCDTQLNYLENLDPNSTVECIPCGIPNCLTCTDFTTCQICNTQGNYFNNPVATNATDQCILCTIPFCPVCSSLSLCKVCNQSIGYFFNPYWTTTADQCQLCAIPQCVECATLFNCLICNETNNFFHNPASSVNGTNGTNISIPIIPISQLCVQCNLTQCIQCLNLDQCSICNETAGYFLNSTDLLCYPCAVPNCIQCQNLTICLICDMANMYFPDPVTRQCYIPPPRCGDNIKLPIEVCDDGNLDDGDGCSSACGIETQWVCQPNPIVGFYNSVCFYLGDVYLTVIYIEKVDNLNQIQILLDLFPAKSSFWDDVDFAAMLWLHSLDGVDSYLVSRNSDSTVTIIINYSKDIHNVEITVEVDPNKSGKLALSRQPVTQKQFPMVPTDNEAALYYDQGTYKISRMVTLIAQIIAGLYLLFFLLALFMRKLVGIELMGVIQISFLALLTLPSLNPNFEALSMIWFVNGFNIFSLSSKSHLEDVHTPLQVKGVSLYSRFTENYNMTFVLILIPYILALICFILAKTTYKQDEQKQLKSFRNAKMFLCETAYNGLMFSGYIIAVSFGLEIVYGTKNMGNFIGMLSVAECTILLLLYLVYFILIAKFPRYFGEFVYCFRKKRATQQEDDKAGFCTVVNWKWYNILMVERIVVGLSLVFLLSVEVSPVVPIVIFLLLGAYAILRRPYLKTMHNVRFACNMLICIIILGIYLGYKKASFIDQHKSTVWFIMPIVVCILLIICLIYNVAILIYELVMKNRTNQGKAELKEQEDFVNFQLLKERSNSNSAKLKSLLSYKTSADQNEAISRRGLDEIRKQIKGDFLRKDSLLNKSSGSKPAELIYNNQLYEESEINEIQNGLLTSNRKCEVEIRPVKALDAFEEQKQQLNRSNTPVSPENIPSQLERSNTPLSPLIPMSPQHIPLKTLQLKVEQPSVLEPSQSDKEAEANRRKRIDGVLVKEQQANNIFVDLYELI